MSPLQEVAASTVIYQHAQSELSQADLNISELSILSQSVTTQMEQQSPKLLLIKEELQGIQGENEIIRGQLKGLCRKVAENWAVMICILIVCVLLIMLCIWDTVNQAKSFSERRRGD